MAITYPRSLPSFVKSSECNVRLQKGTTSALMRGGGVQTVQHSEPYWDMTWTTPPLTRAQKAELTAWWDSLRGGLKTFLAYDPAMAFPSYYGSEAAVLALNSATGSPFTGIFVLTKIFANELRSVGGALSEPGLDLDFLEDTYSVTTGTVDIVSRPPANFRLSAGDLISVTQSGRYSLHRIVETVTSNSYGNFNSSKPIRIEPAITTSLFTDGVAVANVVKPLAEFVPDDTRFEATQTISPSPATFGGFSRVIY